MTICYIYNMRTVSQAVEEVMCRSPFLAEAIVEGIANYAEVARRIKPDVEKRLFEEVSETTIAMALHRMAKGLRRPMFGMRFLKQLNDITVRSNLVEFICPNADGPLAYLEMVSKSAMRRKDSFVNFSRGLHESLFFLDEESAKALVASSGKGKNIRRIDHLSAITLRLPDASLDVPGLYYPILKALASDGISFIEVMSVRTELSIIFDDKDVDRAFSAIKRVTA